MLRFFFILAIFFASCNSPSDPPDYAVSITGREPERIDLYRIKVPFGWRVVYPDPDRSLTDSRLPLLELFIEPEIRIAIHNFPVESLDERIPPQAQVQRWIGQISDRDKASTVITPQSFSGYAGLRLETGGKINEQEVCVIGWAMQLGREHFKTLSSNKNFPEQSRADVTIKVSGPPDQINLYRDQIFQFAKSFELIEEIPPPR